MKLPYVEQADVPCDKIAGYLLSFTHRSGRAKVRLFSHFGFSADAWETLAAALTAHVAAHEVARTEASCFGMRYIIEGPLDAPDGRRPAVRAVWFIEEGGGIKELAAVVLPDDVPEHGLMAGDLGTVVLTHRGGEGYEVEFATLAGDTVAVVTLLASQVRPVRPDEIAHARLVTG